MATIDIKLSQSALAIQPASGLGVLVDGIEAVVSAAAGYQNFISSQLSGASLVHTYRDGAVETYSGFVKDKAGAGNGTATATGYELELKDNLSVSYAGKLNLDYTSNPAGVIVNMSAKGSVINDIGYAQEYRATDYRYDPHEGNMSVRVQGTLNLAANDAITGTINRFLITGEQNMTAVTVDGDFHVSGNLLTDGEGLTHSSVSGTLTGYHLAYADGSHVDVSGVSAALDAPASVNIGLVSNPDYFGGNDTVNLDLPANIGNYLVATGAGEDQISIRGGSAKVMVDGGDGNDRITLLDDGHTVLGGKGIDTVVLQAARADYQLSLGTTIDLDTVKDRLGIENFLIGVERIQFSDASVALDIDGKAGEAYRLYQAAFARTPDKAGLGYWINALDQGADLLGVAEGFAGSDEFKAIYGASPSNHDVVERFYQNILQRAPDQAGLDYWVAVLDNKVGTVAQVLMAMSESAENKAGLIGVIGNGFEYTPYH